jgi:hypothetical protein
MNLPVNAITAVNPFADVWGDAPKPYLVLKDRNLAIFGVVDPDFKESVGPSNLTWVEDARTRKSKGERTETSVVVADPASSLDQVLQRCEIDSSCNSARKILLAQMPAAQAQLLALRLKDKFDFVLSQTDNKLATGDEERQITLADGATKTPAFVLTPRQIYDVSIPGTTKIHRVILDIMRSRRSSDVALLQRRDFFEAAFTLRRPRPESWREMVSRWSCTLTQPAAQVECSGFAPVLVLTRIH